ncbi:DNA-directed RNA polymerase subunit delta [Granulicatella seriolae]|uniref:Probable DNA-directed RNA polymerase subunit delta n=1 Tax=Granulicatella seriolae TaxID=2967226 RepID=A0ABT1WNY1_9LACT|nr:DNA-directed RNA polymerase subunit delta [Granulicatella seriolae]
MELKEFEGINKKELSMIEVAHAILEQTNDVLEFNQLLVDIQEYLELTDDELEAKMTNFYTDLNIDGSFISLGDNRWGLRSWYPIDSIDEEIISSIDDDDLKKRRKKRKKVNAFGDEEDLIDYNDDDPEDDDVSLDDDDDDDTEVDDDDDDVEVVIKLNDDEEEEVELDAYRSDLSEIGADEDIEDEVSAEENLIIVDDEDIDPDLDEESDEEDDEKDL